MNGSPTLAALMVAATRSQASPAAMIVIGAVSTLVGLFWVAFFRAPNRGGSDAYPFDYSGQRSMVAWVFVVIGVIVLILGILRAVG